MSSVEIANLLLSLIATVAVVSTIGGIACVAWVTRARRNLPEHAPAVTIFKPLKGMDEGLEQNLRSFFLLEYPCFQLLFCVADDDDPAIDVVRKLMGEFPDRDAKLIVGCPAFGLNPKVESLAAMDRHRKHDVILISDSNVRARPSYLRETVCYLKDPGVGLVTNLFAGVGEVHPAAVMENLQLNGFIAAGVAAASVFRATCVVGKSMLLPVKVLQAIGGFAAVRNVLAEDQVIGSAGSAGRLLDPIEPSRGRKRELAPRAQVVFEPSFAVVQDPPPARLAGLYFRAGREPGDRRAGLGFLGRFGRRLGGAVAAGRTGNGARRHSVPQAPRVVSRGSST